MTVQFPQIEAKEPCLLGDSYKQNSSDQSFEEKLKFEQARLGLLFSPFSQLESAIFSTFNDYFNSTNPETKSGLPPANEYLKSENQSQNTQRSSPAPSAQVFDSVPLQPVSRQFLQQLLSQTNWLVPNLNTRPLFYQAFLEGKLQPKLDLQFLIDQIIEQVKIVKEKGRTELSLTLKPEDLGEILLTLTSYSGIVSIQIQSSAETKKLLDAEREELELALKRAKIKIDKIQIEEVRKNA